VLLRAVLLDGDGDEIDTKYNFFKVRDGYVDRNKVQLLNSEINPDPRTWSDNVNSTIADNRDDPFGGTDAYFIEDTSDPSAFVLDEVLQLTGVHTLSVFLKGSNTIQIGADPSNVIIFNLGSGEIVGTTGDIIAYDIFKVGLWYKISFVYDMSLGDRFSIRESVGTGSDSCFFFNPTVTKGNLVNFTPTEVLLQSNTQVFFTL